MHNNTVLSEHIILLHSISRRRQIYLYMTQAATQHLPVIHYSSMWVCVWVCLQIAWYFVYRVCVLIVYLVNLPTWWCWISLAWSKIALMRELGETTNKNYCRTICVHTHTHMADAEHRFFKFCLFHVCFTMMMCELVMLFGKLLSNPQPICIHVIQNIRHTSAESDTAEGHRHRTFVDVRKLNIWLFLFACVCENVGF